MAGRDRGAHAHRRSRRTHHVCSDRRDEGSKPTRRARIRSVTEGKALGPTQAGPRVPIRSIFPGTSGTQTPHCVYQRPDRSRHWDRILGQRTALLQLFGRRSAIFGRPFQPRRSSGQLRTVVWEIRFGLSRRRHTLLLSVHVPPLKISLTLWKQDFAGAGHIISKGFPCQIWKRQFANVPTTSGSPMVDPRTRRTSIG
jgi:hypothetical protein